MKRILSFLPALLLFTALGFTAQQDDDAALLKRAEKLHDKIISVDTHTDTALALTAENVNLDKVQADAQTELGITLPKPEDRFFAEFYSQFNY